MGAAQGRVGGPVSYKDRISRLNIMTLIYGKKGGSWILRVNGRMTPTVFGGGLMMFYCHRVKSLSLNVPIASSYSTPGPTPRLKNYSSRLKRLNLRNEQLDSFHSMNFSGKVRPSFSSCYSFFHHRLLTKKQTFTMNENTLIGHINESSSQCESVVAFP